MLTNSAFSLAIVSLARFGGRSGGGGFVLLVIGLAFAGLLIWAIERSGKTTS